jgi:hypothetical protein
MVVQWIIYFIALPKRHSHRSGVVIAGRDRGCGGDFPLEIVADVNRGLAVGGRFDVVIVGVVLSTGLIIYLRRDICIAKND